MSEPRKVVVAVNPWRLAAEAERRDIEDVTFFESNYVDEDKAFVIDVAAARALIPGLRENSFVVDWPEASTE